MRTFCFSLSLFLMVACGDTQLGDGINIDSSQRTVEDTDTPVITGSTPASPALTQTPNIDGTAEVNANVEIFSDSSCTTSVGSGTADTTGNFSITVSPQEGGASSSYFAQATAIGKNVSACSSTSTNFFSTTIRPGLAFLTGTQSTAPASATQINQATAYAMQWSNSEFDNTYYTHDTTTNSHQVQVNVAGDYWVSATVPQVMTAGTYRPCVRVEVRVNGVLAPGAIGESSYIRFDGASGNNESSAHIAFLLRGLSASDTIEIFVQETAGHDGSEVVNISSVASLYLEYINSSRNLFTASSTQLVSGTNVNPGAASAFEWTEDREDSAFTHDDVTNPENITLVAGNYMLYVNVPLNSSVTRGSPRLTVRLNGATINGGQASQGYIRNDSGHNDSSVHWSGHFTASNGDVLTINMQQEASAGTINVQGGSSALMSLERLDNTAGVISLRATTLSLGTNWNSAAADTISWDTMDVHDTAVYNHSTLANQHQITVNDQGDYLVTYNDAMTSTVQRANPIIKVQVNGVDVPGAESKTHYNRANSSHNESSASLAILLRNLSAGDIITLTSQQNVAAGTVNSLEDALLTIQKK